MLLRHFFTSGLAIHSYLLFDEEAKKGVVIDPTRDIGKFISEALQEEIQITDIIETHVHADFISGAPELKAALGGKAIIHCSGMGGNEWVPSYADHVVLDGDELIVGLLRLQAMHTPGHTPEHLAWLVFDEKRSCSAPVCLFSGDVLLVGSVGRPDLLGEELEKALTKQLYHSLFAKLYHLPDFLEVYPAHGGGSPCGKEIGEKPSTTFGYEKRCNPWLIPQDYSKWREELLKNQPAQPSYFRRMKKINVEGYGQKFSRIPVLLKAEACKEKSTCILVDVRNAEAFAKKHLKGSIHIPAGKSFPLWAGSVLKEEGDFTLVVDKLSLVWPILQALELMGINRVHGAIEACMWGENKALSDLFESTKMLSPDELYRRLDEYYVVDVRSPSEWTSGCIPESHFIELPFISSSISHLPRGKPIATICRTGNRASIAASLISRAGFSSVTSLLGGIQEWKKAGFSIHGHEKKVR